MSILGELPADVCLYARPFPKDFTECPAYEPVEYVPVTFTNDPLRPTWTCGHLEVGRFGKNRQHRYGQCALGDAAGRLQWLKDRMAIGESVLAQDLRARKGGDS